MQALADKLVDEASTLQTVGIWRETGSLMALLNCQTNPVTHTPRFRLSKDPSPVGLSPCSLSFVLLGAQCELRHQTCLGFGP